ncbi:MAG TPA: PQQ-binding-like beta-propeller repeat protein, partial [Chthoniobacteraceae bacterium]|nr:PQQ-binding-like beta-propeller repeat protein [Chthoniobacteraceae bacterium]
DRGVLMCFNEKDGRLLWQLVVPKRSEDPFFDWPNSGISSPATVEGDRVYVVSNRGEVLCLDVHGMANGNDGPFKEEATHQSVAGQPAVDVGPLDADVIWACDLTTGAGIWSHDAAHSSILIRGDHLYLNTGNGVDNSHIKIRRPEAPSLVVIDKKSGRLLARDDERMSPRTFHCTWSAPSMAKVGERDLIFFAGGDGILYAFEALNEDTATSEVCKLKVAWKHDLDPTAPKEDVHRFNKNKAIGPSNVFGMPVVVGGSVYVAGGGDLWWGKNEAWLKRIDAESGKLQWTYPLGKHVMSTPAVRDGLVFIADIARTIHCVDAESGKACWTHEAKGDFWASTMVADGKVYIGTRRGDFMVLAASREKQVISTIELGVPISATPMAANGTLYVATMRELFAISK